MAFWNKSPKTPQDRARQQIRDLSKAAVKSAKQVNKAYPNYDAIYRIQRDYERRVEMVLQDSSAKQYQKKLPKASQEKGVLLNPVCICDWRSDDF
jgi:hypothetical protein